MFRTIICASFCVLALASSASADVVLVSQDRYIRSHSWGYATLPIFTPYDDDKQQLASGFTNFIQTVSSSVTGGGSTASGSATQVSGMTPFVLDVTGGARHSAINRMGGDAFGESESHFEVVFDIFYPQTATLTGYITRNGFDFGSTSLSLTGPSGPISLPMTGAPNNLYLNGTLPLTPGRYTMLARSLAAPNFTEVGDSRDDIFAMRLSVPVPEPAAASLLVVLIVIVRRHSFCYRPR